MLYLLLFISIVAETSKNICNNHFGKNILRTTSDSILFNVISGIGAFFFLLITTGKLHISGYSLGMAVLFAVITAAANYFSLMAVATGPMAISSLFVYMGGMIVPAMFGVLYYQQTVSIFQIIGCFFMIVSLIFNISFKENSRMTAKWLLYAVGSFFMWGFTGICQQIHQNSPYAHELNSFLLYSFLIMILLFLLIFFPIRTKEASDRRYFVRSKSSFYVLTAGVFIGLVYQINLYLSGKLPSIIFFPLVNGGVMLLSALAAILLFREKTDIRQKAGIIIGIAAICLLGIPA